VCTDREHDIGQNRTLETWSPFKVIEASSGTDVEADYVPLEKIAKTYTLCVLFPNLKDRWLAVDYGIAEETRRLGVNMNLHEAGGYENLTRRPSQFDDCVASHARAASRPQPTSDSGIAA
jgi:periplasmic protein TorT